MDLWYEDLTVGHRVISASRLVSRAEIIEFAEKWDPQPFHVDDELAKNSIFGQLVGCGAHTYAITMRFGVDCRVFTGNAVVGLGVDDMRFHAPVHPDSMLHSTFTVSSLRPSLAKPHLGVVGWSAETFDNLGIRVFSAVFKNLYRRRPSDAIGKV